MVKLTASKLRAEVYKILDEIIKTGQAAEIERNGHVLRIVPMKQHFDKLARLKKRRISNENSENFSHIDWTSEWRGK